MGFEIVDHIFSFLYQTAVSILVVDRLDHRCAFGAGAAHFVASREKTNSPTHVIIFENNRTDTRYSCDDAKLETNFRTRFYSCTGPVWCLRS